MSKNKAPVILDKVATLTGIRDLDIFEFSFMKTLADMLRVNEISLYKFNGANLPCRLIRYTSDTEFKEGVKRTDESKEVHFEDIEIPITLSNAIDWIESTGRIYSTNSGNQFLTFYPISALGKTIGYLSVTLTHELSESDNLIISSLLSISENFYSLLEENQKDKLTGLLNRKTFDDNISKIQGLISFPSKSEPYTGIEKRGSGSEVEYWLSIIDVDHFKKVNDTFGHVYGDEVLLLLSQIMKKTFRPTDLLFRVGGEEFVAILQVRNQEDAKKIFERFRFAVESFVFPQVGQVTISLGGTKIPSQYLTSSDIVGKADQALYHAKDNGRNKLFFYEDLVSQGLIQKKCENNEVEFF
jgi:diguanylate cyclase (GGDEF)-like protein